jgi:[ribosomal protein S18]-alanine N-acetyltransferase
VTIRSARPDDAAAIADIRRSSPEAAQWDPAGYDVTVAELDGAVVGFLVTREIAEDEFEVLNLGVAPSKRRAGVARALLETLLKRVPCDVFLEVCESNSAARNFYQALGFQELSRRENYYENPPEAGIVMKFHSC